MKKIITLIILLAQCIANAQCLAPSNLTLSIPNATSAQLNWTENGTANSWEVAIVPDFYIDAPAPISGVIINTSSYLITGLPPAYGCYAFFVRSICSTTDVSPWVAVGTLGCSTDVLNYLATLSNDSFIINEKHIKIYPNPSSTTFKIVSDTKIDKISFFDTLGKEILIQTSNNSEINIENLSKGIYVIEIISENEKIYKKLIKE